jgi:hypothetical protein
MKRKGGSVLWSALALCVAGAGWHVPTAQAADAMPGKESEAVVRQLSRDTDRAHALREIKELQYAYAHYAQFGMWDEMAALFAVQGEYTDGKDVVRGREAIARHFLDQWGGGKPGLPPGGLHNRMFFAPAVTLSYDGRTAQGRWTELAMLGRYGERADWEGGMEVNQYVKENGVWKFARLQYYPQFAGPAETGWRSLAPDTPLVPYPYTPGQAGRPVPDEAGDADQSTGDTDLAAVERRIEAMNDEDKVRNLQNIYGYYVDRKMWDDVTDLFAPDGVLEIAGVGIYKGVPGVRRALERDGPAGLQRGQVNDQIQLETIVTIDPDGRQASARGMQLGMLTPKLGEAYWSVSVFENRYVKIDGTWRIREMRIFPKMKTDYYVGWARSRIEDPAPTGKFAPDSASLSREQLRNGTAIPAFRGPSIGTGKPVAYPPGTRPVWTDNLLSGPVPAADARAGDPRTKPADFKTRIAEARRKLAVSKAYDAVENVSSNFGYYLDDSLWEQFVDNMAERGTRPQGAGFYMGRERLYRAMVQSHTAPWSPTNPIDGIRLHLRLQPVIDVAPDASSAKIRTRMFLYYANTKQAGAWNSGMYPNDNAVLENGVWKMNVGGIIDETYFHSPSYKEGWAKPRPPSQPWMQEAAPAKPGAAPVRLQGGVPARNAGQIGFEPDIPWSVFDDYRRKDFRTTNWPDIKPMWFHYRNPVSGRTPPFYCPDFFTCYKP